MKNITTHSSIVITGSIAWDIIMNFPNKFVDYLQPKMLHQINVSFVVDSLEKQMGGTGTNISFAVSQATKQILNPKSQFLNKFKKQNPKQKQIPVYLLGGLGKDGREHIAFFKKHNINTEGVVVDKELYCASGTVITDCKDNQIWGFYYGACTRGKDVEFKRFVKQNSVMIVSANHSDAFLTAQNYAISNKIAYMYDCGMALSWIKKQDLQSGIKHCKWLVGNDYEIAHVCKILGTTIKNIVDSGVEVITTLGEKGVRYEVRIINSKHQIPRKSQIPNNQIAKQPNNQQQTITIPVYKVKKVVDPTGAGDAWRGGFLAAVSLGIDTEACLKIGNVMASFAIESYGTVNYKVISREFEKRLQCLKS